MKKNRVASYITRTAIMLALALIFQFGLRGVGQSLVGPLVNFVLIMAGYLVNTSSGIIIGCLTPLLAFTVGIMPLFPLVPFVMIGNSLYVYFFNFFRNKINDIISIVLASLIKFIFLATTIRYVVPLFVKIPPKVIQTFSLPQLYTGIVGGILAIVVRKILPESLFIED